MILEYYQAEKCFKDSQVFFLFSNQVEAKHLDTVKLYLWMYWSNVLQ